MDADCEGGKDGRFFGDTEDGECPVDGFFPESADLAELGPEGAGGFGSFVVCGLVALLVGVGVGVAVTVRMLGAMIGHFNLAVCSVRVGE